MLRSQMTLVHLVCTTLFPLISCPPIQVSEQQVKWSGFTLQCPQQTSKNKIPPKKQVKKGKAMFNKDQCNTQVRNIQYKSSGYLFSNNQRLVTDLVRIWKWIIACLFGKGMKNKSTGAYQMSKALALLLPISKTTTAAQSRRPWSLHFRGRVPVENYSLPLSPKLTITNANLINDIYPNGVNISPPPPLQYFMVSTPSSSLASQLQQLLHHYSQNAAGAFGCSFWDW